MSDEKKTPDTTTPAAPAAKRRFYLNHVGMHTRRGHSGFVSNVHRGQISRVMTRLDPAKWVLVGDSLRHRDRAVFECAQFLGFELLTFPGSGRRTPNSMFERLREGHEIGRIVDLAVMIGSPWSMWTWSVVEVMKSLGKPVVLYNEHLEKMDVWEAPFSPRPDELLRMVKPVTPWISPVVQTPASNEEEIRT